ncbi:MAG: MBL fold metallo-hydrolase [Oscillospiraceae bacterium]|jgi:glyoxylase-like metal-dependent hydrolase (beta-lactamase superfamily II)|nr:MBL fold metallo-hydrolase [Oscillospiraceae bacterium]
MPIETIKIADGAYRFEQGGVRSTLIVGTERAVLVDTGFGNQGSLRAEVEKVTQLPVTLVISHADGDHTGGNAEFDVAHMHPAEFAHYRTSNKDGAVSPLRDGDVFNLGGRRLEVILIPGHTPGSIALLDSENRVLISGDSVCLGPIFMFGEWRSLEAFKYSMDKLSARAGEFDTIYTSHGEFPATVEQLGKQIVAADKLLRGELEAEGGGFIPGVSTYMYDGAGFYY